MAAVSYPCSGTVVTGQALTATYTSPQVAKELQIGMYIEAIVTGGTSPTGTVTIQSSASGASNSWNTVLNTSQAITGDGVTSWNLSGQYYKFWRLVYTYSSGSGSLTVNYNMN